MKERAADIKDVSDRVIKILMGAGNENSADASMPLCAAALGVSAELYEAAELDGAGYWQKFSKITIPEIWPTVSFCIVTTTISSLQMFDQAYVMTKGGPTYHTETLVQYIYDRGFQTAPYSLSYASAISVYLFLIIALVTFVLRRFVLNREGGEAV